jgi:hypothetical protein
MSGWGGVDSALARAHGLFDRPYLLRSPIGYDGRNRKIAKRTLILVVVLG